MKMNSDEIYENGEYLKKNPTWDAEHSPAKAANIFKILQQNNISPKTLAEIGCGAGESSFNSECEPPVACACCTITGSSNCSNLLLPPST